MENETMKCWDTFTSLSLLFHCNYFGFGCSIIGNFNFSTI